MHPHDLQLVHGRVSLEQAKAFYGRDLEINLLVQAYKRSLQNGVICNQPPQPTGNRLEHQELVLISGCSGTGKTALANTLLPVVQNDSGFFLSGKFELSGSQDPYAVFVTAFFCFIVRLLDSNTASEPKDDDGNERLTQICDAVQEAVGRDGKVLTDMIPIVGTVDWSST